MKHDLPIKNGIVIPAHELEITTARAGGPGGQHVNKSDTRITIRWNVKQTTALNEMQKERVLRNLASRLTHEGDLIIHNSASRSQYQNKEMAYEQLALIVRKALYVPKQRMKTRVTATGKESRLREKSARSSVK